MNEQQLLRLNILFMSFVLVIDRYSEEVIERRGIEERDIEWKVTQSGFEPNTMCGL